MDDTGDFVRSLGLPFLAHRLRRASELILEGSSEALRRYDYAGPARSASTLLLLDELGSASITEIASRLRLSHPLIIKLCRALAEARLVREEGDTKDRRRRLIALTEEGRAQVRRINSFSRALSETFSEMFAEAGADLFEAVEKFEAAAARTPVASRIDAALKKQDTVSSRGGKA
jgi:DNA-binding MarR family transcriptional regulator